MFKEEQGQRDVAEEILHGRGGFLANDEKDQEERKETLEERRKAKEEGLSKDEEEVAAYKSLTDLQKIEKMGDGQFTRSNDIDAGRDFTVRTSFFRIVVTARRENFLRRQVVVLERHAEGCLTWATEVRLTNVTDLPE
jgi:hypothetical protein